MDTGNSADPLASGSTTPTLRLASSHFETAGEELEDKLDREDREEDAVALLPGASGRSTLRKSQSLATPFWKDSGRDLPHRRDSLLDEHAESDLPDDQILRFPSFTNGTRVGGMHLGSQDIAAERRNSCLLGSPNDNGTNEPEEQFEIMQEEKEVGEPPPGDHPDDDMVFVRAAHSHESQEAVMPSDDTEMMENLDSPPPFLVANGRSGSPTQMISETLPPINSPPLAAAAAAPPPPPELPIDPALEQFRTVRTFRTRTTLQLQPYTRERQLYEAVLRRGGLKKGRTAIAPAKEISKSSEDEDEEAQQSSSSSASEAVDAPEESAERIVIGNTPPLKPVKHREPVPVLDADYDEYFLEHGLVADEGDPQVLRQLQRIARARLKREKEEKRRERRAEKARREFERLVRQQSQLQPSSEDEVRGFCT